MHRDIPISVGPQYPCPFPPRSGASPPKAFICFVPRATVSCRGYPLLLRQCERSHSMSDDHTTKNRGYRGLGEVCGLICIRIHVPIHSQSLHHARPRTWETNKPPLPPMGPPPLPSETPNGGSILTTKALLPSRLVMPENGRWGFRGSANLPPTPLHARAGWAPQAPALHRTAVPSALSARARADSRTLQRQRNIVDAAKRWPTMREVCVALRCVRSSAHKAVHAQDALCRRRNLQKKGGVSSG